MNTKLIEGLQALVDTIPSLKNIDVACVFSDNEIVSLEDFNETIINGDFLSIDIDYFGSAIEFLTENDPSLMEVFELINDLGIEPTNSAQLASILASEYAKNDFLELHNDLEVIFNEVEV